MYRGGEIVNVLQSAARLVGRSAETVVATAGAVGGALTNGVVEGLRGAARGAKSGLAEGTQSTPAAVLAFAAVGATGLVEWPVLLGVGATAYVLRRLNPSSDGDDSQTSPKLAAVSDEHAEEPTRPARKASPRPAKTTAATPRKATAGNRRAPAKK